MPPHDLKNKQSNSTIYIFNFFIIIIFLHICFYLPGGVGAPPLVAPLLKCAVHPRRGHRPSLHVRLVVSRMSSVIGRMSPLCGRLVLSIDRAVPGYIIVIVIIYY